MKALWNAFVVTLALAMPLGIAGAQNAPFAGGKKMTTAEALKAAPGADPTLVPFDKAFKAAEAKLKKSPKDAKVKKAYVDAAFKYGHAAMERGQVSPRIMYRASLALYRKALAVDPKHKPSLDEKKLIEDIYAGMPGGIPK
jgi:tetratricopeptide (TPR) repeat protein